MGSTLPVPVDRPRSPLAYPLFVLLSVAVLALSFALPYHVTQNHLRLRLVGKSPHHFLQFFVPFFLFTPTVANLVLVLIWRNTGSSFESAWPVYLDLRRYLGRGRRCVTHAPSFGVILAHCCHLAVGVNSCCPRTPSATRVVAQSHSRDSQVAYNIA
jgi:hypothetical protein